MEWTFELTNERIPQLQQQYEWMLQHRNHGFSDVEPRKLVLGFWIVLVATASVGLAILFATDHDALEDRTILFAALAGCVIAGVIRALTTPRKIEAVKFAWVARSDRKIGAALAARAARTYQTVEARAPYRITYRLDDGGLDTWAEALGPIGRLELARIKHAIIADDIVFVFRRTWSQRPARTLYVPANAERDALVETLRRAGVPCVRISGGVPHYTAPIPEATQRSPR